jgi:drug/metabolite transporter (DMT)-like permease
VNRAAWWLVFALAVFVGLVGDVAMKRAGVARPANIGWLSIGFASYGATGFGWFLLLRSSKLSTFGVLYPVANAVGLVALGAVFFGERLGTREWLGIALGGATMMLLGVE